MKLIPREEPEKARRAAQEKRQRQAAKNAGNAGSTTLQISKTQKQSASKQSPHLQKQYALEHNVENKKIKTVGYKLVNYATNIARLSQEELSDLIHDAQRSVLFLQKHHRKMIVRAKRKKRS